MSAATPELTPELTFRARGRSRRRKLVNLLMEALATLAALLAIAVLAIVVISVVKHAFGALNWAFFTQTPVTYGQTGGGIKHAIIGSAILVGLATLLSVPIGVLIAIYVSEFSDHRVARFIRLALDMLNALPSIVIGAFAFGLLVLGHQQNGYAGTAALAVIMLPLVARSTQEVLALVPSTLREAALALGASKWRTILGVILPTSLGGILTGSVLAIARAAGETAPLLFTTSVFSTLVSTDPGQALPNIPVLIFNYSESPDPSDHQKAWAASLVLIAFVLVASVSARVLHARSVRKLGR